MFFILVLIFLTVLLYLYDKKEKSICKEIPGPPPLPFIGNAHECVGTSTDFFQIVNGCWHEFGTRVKVFLGPKLMLLLSDPKDVEVVMSNQEFINKAAEYDFFHPWLGTGLLTSTGEKWRAHRKIITPAFHFKILENFMDVFDSQTDILIEKLKGFANKGAFDVYPIMTMYALDIISETAMGVSINAQRDEDSKYVKAVKDMCEIVYGRVKNPLKRADILFRLSRDYRRQKAALKILHDFTNRMIRERRKLLQERNETMTSYTNEEEDNLGRKKKMAFLDLLLLSTLNGKPLSDVAIREEVDTFLFEGHDTTTSALSFALYLISTNPDVQKKLYDEQAMIFGNDSKRSATYSDLQDMKYMELAIKEALRLFPSVPILSRETSHDTKINDISVPGGASIVVLVYNMNRNPAVFPEPDKFIPERFLPDQASKRNPFSTVSFSAGPRNCIGQKFAMMEMKSSLSKIVRTFELLPSPHGLELKCDVILKSETGVTIVLKSRE